MESAGHFAPLLTPPLDQLPIAAQQGSLSCWHPSVSMVRET